MKLLIRQAPHRTFLAAWGYSFEPILSRTNAPPELTTAFRRVVNSSPTCGAKPFKHLLSSACGRNGSRVFTRTIPSICRSLPMIRFTAMNIAAAVNVKSRLLPAVTALRNAVTTKSEGWKNIVKIGRTHMQDADTAHPRPGVVGLFRDAR